MTKTYKISVEVAQGLRETISEMNTKRKSLVAIKNDKTQSKSERGKARRALKKLELIIKQTDETLADAPPNPLSPEEAWEEFGGWMNDIVDNYNNELVRFTKNLQSDGPAYTIKWQSDDLVMAETLSREVMAFQLAYDQTEETNWTDKHNNLAVALELMKTRRDELEGKLIDSMRYGIHRSTSLASNAVAEWQLQAEADYLKRLRGWEMWRMERAYECLQVWYCLNDKDKVEEEFLNRLPN